MEVEKFFHMVKGAGENSYANNSHFQKGVIMKTKPMVEVSIKEVYNKLMPECLMMADLGCSSGPNALLVAREVIDIISSNYRNNGRGEDQDPQLGLFLSDLPSNDFNNLFSLLPNFYNNVEGIRCFVSGTPGSFYGRLFPNRFLHFVYSCYGLHWLSQVPEGLFTGDGEGLKKRSIFIASTSSPEVSEAYYSQFKKDFTMFLSERGREMVHGGCMVLATLCRVHRKDSFAIFDLFDSSLNDMVLEGIIEEQKLDDFNIPFYSPTLEEVKQLVKAEGSFSVDQIETVLVDWNVNLSGSLDIQAQFIAKQYRAILQSILLTTFDQETLGILFHKFRIKVEEKLRCQKCEYLNLVVSMTKKYPVPGVNGS